MDIFSVRIFFKKSLRLIKTLHADFLTSNCILVRRRFKNNVKICLTLRSKVLFIVPNFTKFIKTGRRDAEILYTTYQLSQSRDVEITSRNLFTPFVRLKYESHSACFYEIHSCLTKTSKYSCTEFHENPTNVLVADMASRTVAVSTYGVLP